MNALVSARGLCFKREIKTFAAVVVVRRAWKEDTALEDWATAGGNWWFSE